MNISQQVFAPFAIRANANNHLAADVNSFVLRLLLFDTYIVESSLLRDIAQLANVFGVEGLIDIIDSGAIKLHVDALSIGQAEQTVGDRKFPVEGPNSPEILPLLHYAPIIINMADRSVYINRALENLQLPRVGKKTTSKLRNATIDKLTTPPDYDPKILQWTKQSLLSNDDVAVTALEQVLFEKYHIPLIPTAFHFVFRENGTSGYAVTTNIGNLFKLNSYDEHKIFESVVLKVAGFYQRLSLMNSYLAIAWFSDSDARILDAEIKTTLFEHNSSRQEQRFTRILTIAGLPTILPNQQINAHSLLRLRETKECKEFRAWLNSSDAKSDNDIKRELTSFRAAFAATLHSGAAKTIRFIVPNALAIDPVASMATQILDKLVIEKFLPANGPIAFINNKLPPVLRNDPYKN